MTVVLGLFVLAQSQAAATPNCTASQFVKADKCVDCSATAEGGIAGCTACTYAAEKLTCNTCAVKKVLKEDKSACEDCTANCDVCSGPGVEGDEKCTTCSKGFFKGELNKCNACDSSCGECSTATACSACKAADTLLNRPEDDGKCLSSADCTTKKGVVGYLSENVKVCSMLLTPLVSDKVNATYTLNNSLLSLDALCAPSSADKAEAEMVGAVVANTPGDAGQKELKIFEIREAIRGALNVKPEDFAKENRGGVVKGVNWLNIIGTKASTAALKDFRVAKGKSVLEYVCVNSLNVVSALKSITINNTAPLNNNVRFGVSFKRALNATELTNLTCSVANALFPDNPVLKASVKNNQGGVCAAPAARLLQAAASIVDYYFDVPANQYDDSFESATRGKLSAVKTAVTSFSTAFNATVGIDVADSAVSTTVVAAPVVTLNATAVNSSSITLNVTSTENAQVTLVVVNASYAVTDELLRGSATAGSLYKESFAVDAKATVSKVVSKNLNASTAYKVHYYAVNRLDSTKSKNGSIDVTTTSASSSSAILALGSLILLVFALFI